MQEPIGRREASKRATRAAILEAARRLVSERGYDRTTVREIAEAAGVTERTFYRYFGDKDGLIAEEGLAWMERLSARIVARPASEPPLTAVREALVELAREIAAAPQSAPLWTFSEEPGPLELLRRASRRPLLTFERAITDAVLERTGSADEHAVFEAELTARVSLAVLRTAAARTQATRTGAGPRPGAAAAIEASFDELARLAR